MDYRDERNALRGRVDNLEQELQVAKKELEEQRDKGEQEERVKQMEREMADARRQLDRLGAELARVRGDQPRASKAPLIVGVVLGAVFLLGVSTFVLLRSVPEPALPPLPAALPVVARDPVPEPPTPAPPVEPPSVASEPAHSALARTTTAQWSGKVTRATGIGVSVGSTCSVSATLASSGSSVKVPNLDVTCAGKPLYRSSDPLEGMSQYGSSVEEDSGAKPQTYRYALAYQDKGPRSGKRSEVSIDTTRKVAAVWTDSVPAFRVEFSLPYQSEPVAGEPLLEATRAPKE